MSRIPEQWTVALNEVAEDLLSAAGLTRPPVDALVVADRLEVPVAFDGRQAARGRHKKLSGRPAIFLKPDDRPERIQWAAAHELGEVVAWQVIQRVFASDTELSPRLREDVANRLASHLLLPSRWFFQDANRLQANLLELKPIYRTASHELIALRLLDRAEPTIITVFDQGRLTRRRSNGPAGRRECIPWNVTVELRPTGPAGPSKCTTTACKFKAGRFMKRAGSARSSGRRLQSTSTIED